MYRFEEPWTSWEMHPSGEEVVCCMQGHMTLHQELPDGAKKSHELGPGDYAINPPRRVAHGRYRWPGRGAVHHRGEGNENRPR